MKLSRLPGKPGQYLPLVLLWLVLWLLLPRTAKFGYDYRKGSPWKHENLIAQFDFPILKTEEQILEEKSKSDGGIVPYYRYASDVANRNIKAAEGLDLGVLKSTVVGEIRSLYERGIVSDAGVKTDKKGDPNGEFSAAAFYLPHSASIAGGNFMDYARTVKEVEAETGEVFFASFASIHGEAAATAIKKADPATTLSNWK